MQEVGKYLHGRGGGGGGQELARGLVGRYPFIGWGVVGGIERRRPCMHTHMHTLNLEVPKSIIIMKSGHPA